jgi:cytochrome c oxidase subunit II
MPFAPPQGDISNCKRSNILIISIALAPAFRPQSAIAATPLNYLTIAGERTAWITPLLWGLIGISVAVVLMAIVLVLWGTFHGSALPADALPGRVEVSRGRSGFAWILIGVVASAVVLFGVMVWTVVTVAALAVPSGGDPLFNIEIVGHQWWWEVRYKSNEPGRNFRTANEIHVPVGLAMGVTLKTADVIHSFWVPALTGKTDLVPGQTNETWFTASKPGIYRGQCTEYCGQQHAHMGLEVIADEVNDFRAWWDHQLEPASAPMSDPDAHDQRTFLVHCGLCHTVRGTPAGGILGPDLSHLMKRRSIAAATLPNRIGYLSAWIADPQRVKPGALMPRLGISGLQLTEIRRFLETLD